MPFLILLFAGLLSSLAVASTARDNGTFNNPSARVRPRFRYWLPDASVNKSLVAENIKAAGDIGAGGVEFIPFYGYGGTIDTYIPASNWSKNGFGTPAFIEVFQTALEAHKENGLFMDFPLGPNQGQGVPAESDDEGLQWDLNSHSSVVATNGSFSGVIPGWEDGKLVALVSARVLSETNVTISDGASFPPPAYTSYSRLSLGHASLKDLTPQVSSSGHASLDSPAPVNGSSYRLFAFYERRTLDKNLAFPYDNPKTIFDNGSHSVDHFSAKGAKTIANFWKKYMLKNEIKELINEAGNYVWEDSIELRSNTTWTPSIPAKFEEKHGYSIRRFLPLLMWGNVNLAIQPSEPGQMQCVLDTEDAGQGYINDYRAILQDCYREYVEELQAFIHDDLDLQASFQVSYNMPMDTAVSIPLADVPECESLQWSSNVDGYRQFTGAAHLAGKNVISNELGAEKPKAFQVTIPHLLWAMSRAVAGGVNQFVIHGQTYSGNYYNTTWPGYTPFSYTFSEIFSEKQPVWAHGLSQAMDYMSRVQFVQQKGSPKADIAIYNKVSASNPMFPTLYSVEGLVKAGWTYEYLTPDNLLLPQARVQGNVLAQDGPQYKALVLPDSANLTLEAVRNLKSYAEAGLPIIFNDDTPGYYPSGNGSGQAAVELALSELLDMEHVHSSGSQQLPQLLSSIGLDPQIRTETNSTLYTTWREDADEGVDYAFLFCDLAPCRGRVHISSTKTPYFLNPWTGQQTPVLEYNVLNNKTVLPLRLQGNQTAIIAFAKHAPDGAIAPTFHATETPSNLLGYHHANATALTLRLGGGAPASPHDRLTLSTGTSVSLNNTTSPSNLQPITLRNWTLTAEHWAAPSNLSDAATIAATHNTTHHLPALTSWRAIPALQNVSGVGFYATSFRWPPPGAAAADGAYVALSRVLHAATLFVNGNRVPPLDVNDARADVGEWLVEGANRVEVVAPSTMWNYLRSVFRELRDVGAAPLVGRLLRGEGEELPGLTDNGLVGRVEVWPYVDCEVVVG